LNITNFCIKRPVTTIMFFSALTLLGIVSASKMKMDLFPEVTYPTLNVNVNYSGAGPEEIEQMVTIPVEQAVATVNGVKTITSVSREGSARITLEFDWGRNIDEAANDVRASLDRVKRRLPDGADTPSVFKYDPSATPIMSLGVSGQLDDFALRRFAEDDLTNLLQRADGVASVDVMGGKREEINVRLRRDRLQAFGITGEQVIAALAKENATIPAGHLTNDAGDFLLRTKGEFKDLDEIRNLVVATKDGIPIYLSSLADVVMGAKEERSIVRIDGKPGIVVSVRKRADANTVATADEVYKVLEEVKHSYPNIQIRVLRDNSQYIRNAVKSVSDSAVSGGVLAALVLLFFLSNLRITAIATVVMPISILATLILAYFSKMTLNTISLGGLALGVGMLVDNSVVVLDNIFRHHQHGAGSVQAAASLGTAEMGPALMASTLTTICVFFPLVFLSGRNGLIYKELSYMIIYSLLCSLLVAVTLIPTLCAKFLKEQDLEENGTSAKSLKHRLFAIQHRWEEVYEKALRWSLAHKRTVITACVGAFLATLALVPLIGIELVQSSDEGVVNINLVMPAGTQLAETANWVQWIEDKVNQLVPEVENREVTVGGRWGSSGQTERGYLTLRLRDDRKRTTQEIVNLLQPVLRIPGAQIFVRAQNSMRRFYGSSDDPIVIDVRGYDQVKAKEVANTVIDAISPIPGVINVGTSRDEERPEIVVRIDRQRAADLGITADQIGNAFQMSVEGKIATIYRKEGREYEVRVNLREEDRLSLQDLGNIHVTTARGQQVPLSGMVTFIQSSSKVNIERKNQERIISVEAGVAKRDLGSVVRDVRQALRKVPLPPGITLHLGGDFAEQEKSNAEMTVVLILALILVYMVMASQFESFLDPFLIMFSVPFALTGVILILFLTDTAFNSQVFLGLIMLGGIVVNNAIVLISYFRILLEKGMGLTEAVLAGGRSRLRPILITTVTTVLGLLPLALGIGEGSETQTPLARTVIGGLTVSTVLTLFLIPIAFVLTENLRQRLQDKRKNKRLNQGPAALVVILFLVVATVAVPSPCSAASEQPQVLELTVETAVQLALEQGTAHQILTKQREAAFSTYREAMADKRFSIFAQGDARLTPDEDEHQLYLTAEQRIYLHDLIGARSNNDRIIEANLNIALNAIELQKQALIYQTVEAFQKAVKAENDLQLAKEHHARAQSFQDEIRTRAKAGLTTVTDEMGAEARLASALTEVHRQEKIRTSALSRLKRLLGLAEETKLRIVPTATAGTNREPNREPALAVLIEQAMASRPDALAARETVARAEALHRLARLTPKLGMELNWEIQRENLQGGLFLANIDNSGRTNEWQLGWNTSLVTGDPALTETKDWGTINLNFKYLFYDGGRVKERINQARLLVEQATAELQQTRETIALDVEQAYYDFLTQKDRLTNAEIQHKYQKTYLEATEARMRSGIASVQDVLDAQNLWAQANYDLESAKTDLYLAEIKLLQVIGGLTPELKYK